MAHEQKPDVQKSISVPAAQLMVMVDYLEEEIDWMTCGGFSVFL